MKKKVLLIIFACFLLAVFLDACLYLGINYYVIPRLIAPQLESYLHPTRERPFSLSIGKVSFHPIRGFILREVVLSQSQACADNYILRAHLVDINPAFLPLLSKRVEIKRLWIFNPDINIARDEQGNWNIGFLFLPSKGGGSRPAIREFRIKGGRMNYRDQFNKDNSLSRRFVNLDVGLKNSGSPIFKLNLTANAENKQAESLYLKLDYDTSKRSAQGAVKLNTRYLSEYWDYYLDDTLKPWNLQIDNVAAEAQFTYSGEALELNGQYNISGGVLAYGDFNIRGNATVKQYLKYVKGNPVSGEIRCEVCLRDGSFRAGDNVLLAEAGCQALITKDEIQISRLSATIHHLPLSLTGKIMRRPEQEVYLTGEISGINSEFDLKLLPQNQGTLEWNNVKGASYLKLLARMPDVKSLLFDLALEGDIKLEDLLGLQKNSPGGKIKISGNIAGEADKSSSYQGKADAVVEGLTWLGFGPQSFSINAIIKDGLLKGGIPAMDYYKGLLSGTIQMNIKQWGIGLDIEKAYLEEFLKTFAKSKNSKGIFSGNLACVSEWGDFNSLKGGGYFKLTSGDLRGFPLFSIVESGIRSIIADFIMPVFYSIEGNFSLDKDGININNAICYSPTLNLGVTGKYNFCGTSDFTLGATLSGGGIIKTARRIIFPLTVSIDLLADSIRVNVNGNWPDLKQKTKIQPMAWFKDFLNLTKQISPSKYTLDKLWL